MNKETCGGCGKEKTVRFVCNFCFEGRMCKECGSSHRSWCMATDDWEFIK